MTIFQEISSVMRRLLSLEISELAIRLAEQEGEAIKRPLERYQIERAMLVHQKEYEYFTDWLFDLWNRLEKEEEALKAEFIPASSPPGPTESS